MTTPPRLASLGPLLASTLLASACAPAHRPQAPTPVAAPTALVVPSHSLVTMEAVGAGPLVATSGDANFTVRVRVTAPPLLADQRAPLDLALVLDTSGSMDGDAIDAARDAARAMVARMGAHDRVAIISFNSRAEVLVPMIALDDTGRHRAEDAIDHIRATGTTDLAGGLAAGLDELARNRTAGGFDRMVLLSDGVPNSGDALQALVTRATQERVAISSLGVGLEFDEALLGRIAQDTGGEYRYAPDAEQVARIFDEEITRMQTVVASNLTLTVKPGPGVELGSAPWLTITGADRQAFLGDLAAGETRDVFIPVKLEPHAAGASVEVLDADLSLVEVTSGQVEQRHAFVGARASADPKAIAGALVIDLASGRARADAAGVILQAIGLARQGLVDRAEQLLVDGEKAARAAAVARNDDELEKLARRMVDIRKSLVFMRTAQVVAPPPPVGIAITAAPYPIDKRPTAQAPIEVETTMKEAYEASQDVLGAQAGN